MSNEELLKHLSWRNDGCPMWKGKPWAEYAPHNPNWPGGGGYKWQGAEHAARMKKEFTDCASAIHAFSRLKEKVV